jgi:hypothetical protein
MAESSEKGSFKGTASGDLPSRDLPSPIFYIKQLVVIIDIPKHDFECFQNCSRYPYLMSAFHLIYVHFCPILLLSTSQPAQKKGRCIKKNMNSVTSMMYIRVCPVSYDIVVMFTCTLVRSHPDSRRRCHKQLYTRLGVATRCMLVRRAGAGISIHA